MIQKIKPLKIIHMAMCLATVLVYYFLGNITAETFTWPMIDSSSIFFALIPVFAIMLSQFLFKIQIKNIKQKEKVEDKFSLYQAASLSRWSVLEISAFLILILKPEFVLFGIFIIVYLIILRPTEIKVLEALK